MLAHQRQQHGGSDPTLPMASDGGWSNVGISSGVAAVSYSQLLATPGIVGTSPSVSSGTAPSDGGISTAGSSVPGSGSGPGSASGSWAARNMPEGPRLRPLDLALLGAKEDVHAELARTIDELGRWLDVLGVGLARAMSADSAV